MKRRINWRSILPYVMLAVLLIAMFLTVAFIQRENRAEVAATRSNFLTWPFLVYTLIVVLIGIVIGLVVHRLKVSGQIRSLQKFTDNLQALGENRFEDINLHSDFGQTDDSEALNKALLATSSQIEMQISQLNKEQVMLTTVLSQMTDGVLLADNSGKVELLNKAAEGIFNISEEKAIDRSVVEVMRHHSLIDLWEKTLRGESTSIAFEMGVEHKYLQVVGIPLGDRLPGRSMLLFQDLTKTHQLERVRRDFISNISHELRTPMASLKAISETLLDGALEDPMLSRKFVLRMDTEVDNLTMMVNELLELSRIEAGRMNMEFQRIQPCNLISKAVERMALQAERAGLSLSQDCPGNLPQIFADQDRLAQVLINLIHNAIKFTATGGSIDLGAWVHDQDVIFRVRDTGVGISPKDQKRIFERFYKADRSRAGGGTGLGLSICRHMVEAHSGEIWVESVEGEGSSFFFRIPIASPNRVP
ncbi:MAG TPA: ATP-binding protein [Anaerolineaceae bacterium]|nr:ATP-binding protein [Anaerolineaceae bacterium]